MLNLLLDSLAGWLIDAINDIFDSVMSVSITDIMQLFADPDLIGEKIPWFGGFVKVMDWLAWTILVLAAYASIIKAIAAPFAQKEASSPFRLVFRIIAAAGLIAFRPYVFSLISALFMKLPVSFMDIGTPQHLAWGDFKINIVHLMTRFGLVVTLALAELMACVTYMERIISFIIYAYTYPLAVAFSISDENSDLSRQWLQGTISQLLTIILSTYLMKAAEFAFSNVAKNGGDTTYFYTVFTIILFGLCRNSEKILAQYNIRTMQNGETARAIAGGIGSTVGAAMTAVGMIRSGAQTAGDFIGTLHGSPAPVLTTGSAASYANINMPSDSGPAQSRASMAGAMAADAAGVKTKGIRPEDVKIPGSRELKRKARDLGVTETAFGKRNAGASSAQVIRNRTANNEFIAGYTKAAEARQKSAANLRHALDSGETVSAKDAFYGIGADQAMPWFTPGKGNAELVRDGNSDALLISGTARTRDGHEKPASYLFSPEEHAAAGREASGKHGDGQKTNPDAEIHGVRSGNRNYDFTVKDMVGINDSGLKGYEVTAGNSEAERMMVRSGGFGMSSIRQGMSREGNLEAKRVEKDYMDQKIPAEDAGKMLHAVNRENLTSHTMEDLESDKAALTDRKADIEKTRNDFNSFSPAWTGDDPVAMRKAADSAARTHREDSEELHRIYEDYRADSKSGTGTLREKITRETGMKLSQTAAARRQTKSDEVNTPDEEGR